jgi:hypothetical protein
MPPYRIGNELLLANLYSGRISIEAYSNAELLRPERWHSITVDIKIGMMCAGKLTIFWATRISILAPDLPIQILYELQASPAHYKLLRQRANLELALEQHSSHTRAICCDFSHTLEGDVEV